MMFITQFLNFINLLVNKNQKAFFGILTILIALVAVQYFDVYNIAAFAGKLFDALYNNPIFALVPIFLATAAYYLNFGQLRNRVFLDGAVSVKTKEAKSADRS